MPRPVQTSVRALRAFLRAEAAGGAALLLAAVVAVVWANSPLEHFRESILSAKAGPLDVHGWIGEGLMTLFFLIVGLEISRELSVGELRQPRAAALPVLAAVGGMVVPALLYLAIAGGRGSHGWGIPMATDIAFAIGAVTLLGRRVPSGLKLFLLALAIVDDLGAILVIAVAYSDGVRVVPLLVAAAAIAGVWVARGHTLVIAVLGPVAWWFAHLSGVHPTIAGVALGFAVPAGRSEAFEHRLHPLTTFGVVPLFALANAGVRIDTGVLSGPEGRVALAVAVGLVAGKVVGITAATWLGQRLRLGALPEGARLTQVVGVGGVAGIGFTVSLFIADLAFDGDGPTLAAAKVGILGGSVVAAAIGLSVLALANQRDRSPARSG